MKKYKVSIKNTHKKNGYTGFSIEFSLDPIRYVPRSKINGPYGGSALVSQETSRLVSIEPDEVTYSLTVFILPQPPAISPAFLFVFVSDSHLVTTR